MLNRFEIKKEVLESIQFMPSTIENITVIDKNTPRRFAAVGVTDKGKIRSVNEDGFIINDRLGLYLVVDGMGGHDHGVIATQVVLNNFQAKVEKFLHHRTEAGNMSDAECQMFLAHTIEQVNATIYQNNLRRGYSEGKGMGAVIAGLWWIAPGHRGLIFNVGDSRLYLYRRKILTQLTVDHTMFQLWQMQGGLGSPPPKNVVFRALGPRGEVKSDIQIMEFSREDIILLCSDGLSNMVSEVEMSSLLADVVDSTTDSKLQGLAQALVTRANDSGGLDNITAIVLHVNDID